MRTQLKMFLCLVLGCAFVFIPTGSAQSPDNARPRLAVVMVVDQMRADYLTRWSDTYAGGLHRLLEHGAVFTDARHSHAATVTATGHATIATGTNPCKHGVVGNSFYDRAVGRDVHSVDDSTTTIVGGGGGPGASPHKLLRSTIGEWLKQESNESAVCAVSLKGRAAVMMGGHHPNACYWYDQGDGNFISSTYYMSRLPVWATAFNESGLKDTWRDTVWSRTDLGATYHSEDTVAAEAGGMKSSAFPHLVADPDDTSWTAYYGALYSTPFADAFLLRFCDQLLASEKLGADDSPDLLLVSLSAADLVGHAYGPQSLEVRDYYLRLDRQLGIFLDTLDARIGKGNYVFALTSDHGVCPLPELAVNQGMPTARRLMSKDFRDDVARALQAEFPECGRAESLLVRAGYGFVIDSSLARASGLAPDDAIRRASSALERLNYVADVFTHSQLSADTVDNRPFAELFRNSFYAPRQPDLLINFEEGVFLTSSRTGTTHGSPYHYDTDVPIVFYGAGVAPGVHDEPVLTVDIAPTMAALLHVQPEAGVDGTVLPVLVGGAGKGSR